MYCGQSQGTTTKGKRDVTNDTGLETTVSDCWNGITITAWANVYPSETEQWDVNYDFSLQPQSLERTLERTDERSLATVLDSLFQKLSGKPLPYSMKIEFSQEHGTWGLSAFGYLPK